MREPKPVGFHVAVKRVRLFLKYWLPVVLWMFLIFSASGDSKSGQRSSRLIGPVVRWLFPQASPETVEHVIFGVRKCAHVTEYAIFAMLLWRAIRQPVRNDPRPWQRGQIALVLGIAFLYASSDEIHQLFVPNREGRFHDVVIDTTGAALGLGLLYVVGKWRRRTKGVPAGTKIETT